MKQKTGLSIKTALIGIVGVLIVVLMAVSISNVIKTSARKGEATRLMIANEMADYIIVAAGQQAIERGLTATVLSKEARIASALLTKINSIRERGDKAYNKALTMAKTLTVMDASNKPLKASLARLEGARAIAVEARKRADSNMRVAHKEFPPARWISIMSKMIESGANLRMVAITSPDTSETLHKALRFNLVLKQAVWLASEYAGRERAILGGHIAGGKALSPGRMETLKAYRGINELNVNTILALKDDPQTDPAILKSIDQMSAVFLGSFQQIREDVYASSLSGDYNISGAQWIKNATGGIDTILAVSSSVSGVVKSAINDEMAKLKAQMMMAVGLLLFAMLLGIVAFFVIKSKILKPMKNLKEINGVINNIERTGDLSQRINIDATDETGEIAIAFNKMIEKFYQIVREIQGASAIMATSSVELADSATEISQGAKSQTGMATQVATASQEMSATIIDVARNASGAAEAARKANDTACNGTDIVNKTIESMNGIASTAKESSAVIRALGDRSKEIGNIIMVIDDIADQTNLLALNAAIEAARAGEQGRGFAVVADEVRKLAERTGSATKEIGEMIKAIQRETALAITTMDKEVAVVQDGVAFAGQAGSALSDILAQVETVTMVIEQIATASEEQSVTADHISGDIEAVADITIEADKKAQKIVHASEAMSNVAATLQKSVSIFKLSRIADKNVVAGASLEQASTVIKPADTVRTSASRLGQGDMTQEEKIQQLRDNLSNLAAGGNRNNSTRPVTYQADRPRDFTVQEMELTQEEKLRKLRDNLKEIADKKRQTQERIDEERIVLFNQEDLREEDDIDDIREHKVIN